LNAIISYNSGKEFSTINLVHGKTANSPVYAKRHVIRDE